MSTATIHFCSTHRRQPRAISLIETTAVMGANAVLMTAALAVLIAAGRADRQLSDRTNDQRLLNSMVKRLREDIRGSSEVVWDESRQSLRVESPEGGVILHRGHGQQWERRQIAADDASGEGRLTDAFQLPTDVRLVVAPVAAAVGDLVRVSWQRQVEESLAARDPPPVVEMVAAVGRDARLLHP